MTPPVVLTIAGTDSGGGAGLAADLRTFAAHGVHGTFAVTAVTAQNTLGVKRVEPMPTDMVAAQIEAVLADFAVVAVKTGFLGSAEVVELVASYELPNLVVDPVIVNHSGERIVDADRAYRALFAEAVVVTPNWREAELLGDLSMFSTVVTGGHGEGPHAVDTVSMDGWNGSLTAPRRSTRNVHGTGDTFSAAIAAGLAIGEPLRTAVEAAKLFVTNAIERAIDWKLGAGQGPIGSTPA